MDVNILGVIVGGLAFWALGALWYSDLLFGKTWRTSLEMTDDDFKNGNLGLIYGLSVVMMVLMTYGLSIVLNYHETLTPTHAAFHGVLIAVFYSVPAISINYLYQRRPLKLWLIDALYQVLGLALAGAVYALIS